MKSYEVEIKSLLGSAENADKLRQSLKDAYADAKLIAEEKQLNHYFNTPADFGALAENLQSVIPGEKKSFLTEILNFGKKLSVRTRDANGTVIVRERDQ